MNVQFFFKTDGLREYCYYIELTEELVTKDFSILCYLLGEMNYNSRYNKTDDIVEYGYHLNFESPWCSNAKRILHKLGMNKIIRIERTIRVKKEDFVKEPFDIMLHRIYDEPIKSFNLEENISLKTKEIDIDSILSFSKEHGLSFDEQDIEYYTKLFNKLQRNPTSAELYDLAQSNSEHSRHWVFNGTFIIDGIKDSKSLFDYIKKPYTLNPRNSILAFSDNSSSISNYKRLYDLLPSINYKQNRMRLTNVLYHPTLTAETHNFPTGIAPFQGAETGVGGRIRDTHAIGKGGMCMSGLAGYCVGHVNFFEKYTGSNINPIELLVKASNGASDYGNKFGEPIIGGFCRSFGSNIDSRYIEWKKPIMFSAGIGKVRDEYIYKGDSEKDYLIYKIGGPAYRIGIGGGSASSRSQDSNNKELDLCAVQRGDAQMENKLNRLIRGFAELPHNIIHSIHDQGAGGTGNVTKEIIEPYGSVIDLKNMNIGDKTMSGLELWIAEFQEQDTILIKKENEKILQKCALRENVPISHIGTVGTNDNIKVLNTKNETIIDLPINEVLTNIPKKTYNISSYTHNYIPIKINTTQNHINFNYYLEKVLMLPSVCSKRFLTNKVDRSVSGLVVQQSCLGPFHTPIADNFVNALSPYSSQGVVSAIGEQPLKGLFDVCSMVNMTIGEMLTNIISTSITDMKDIKCSGNWMWPMVDDKDKYDLYKAVKEVSNTLSTLGIAIDGGKDSLSMSFKENDNVIKCPKQFVLTGYAITPSYYKRATPCLKEVGSTLMYIDLGHNKYRLGGSAFCQVIEQYEIKEPTFSNIKSFYDFFKAFQELIKMNNIILSCHDRSDGGLITTILEMAFSGNKGVCLFTTSVHNIFNYWFSEELGLVIETKSPQIVLDKLNNLVPIYIIGKVTSNDDVILIHNDVKLIHNKVSILRDIWEKTSFNFESKQVNNELWKQEQQYLLKGIEHTYKYSFSIPIIRNLNILMPKVAIIREEGSNGDREMAVAFQQVGFEVWDVNMNDIMISEGSILKTFRGVVFVGGFSYADVFGAGKGWASLIKYNNKINKEFNDFYNRTDTFSLGICNGCQLMTELGWVDGSLDKNMSGRFESRFSTVKIMNNNSIMLKDMDESILGIWVAHGEGRFVFNNSLNDNTMVLRYVDTDGNPTQTYPCNPNGSENGVAGICSTNGRHLAMMPHPERTIYNWQQPFMTNDLQYYTHWIKMFYNAYVWCCKNK